MPTPISPGVAVALHWWARTVALAGAALQVPLAASSPRRPPPAPGTHEMRPIARPLSPDCKTFYKIKLSFSLSFFHCQPWNEWVRAYLPRNELFPGLKCQNYDDILADDGDGVGLLVERKAGLESKEVLQRERRLCLALLVAIAWVSVQLQVKAIWNQRNHHFTF